jgi:hypothetical protein
MGYRLDSARAVHWAARTASMRAVLTDKKKEQTTADCSGVRTAVQTADQKVDRKVEQ